VEHSGVAFDPTDTSSLLVQREDSVASLEEEDPFVPFDEEDVELAVDTSLSVSYVL
jgi:hypothetical protein